MKKQKTQGQDSGQNVENNVLQSSPESKPKKTRSKSLKVQVDDLSQNGSILNPKMMMGNTLESESASGSSAIQESPSQALPVPRMPSSVDRKAQALKRLGVKQGDVEKAPPITPLLKATVKGGLKVAMTAMRFGQDDEVIADFLSKYDSVPVGDRDHLSWEAIGLAAGIDLKHFYGSVSLAIAQYCANKSRMIVVTNHPMVTKMRVKYAKLAGGEKDRTALDIMAGAQSGPKGPTFIGTAHFGPSSGGDSDDGDSSSAVYEGGDIENHLFDTGNLDEKLIKIRQKQLTD
jgi:hypothetical protein